MNARQANVLLTHVTLLDGRFKRTPEEQAQMAIAWAEVLGEVELDAALVAVNDHYTTETRGIMPADIVAAMPPVRSSSYAGNITEQRLAREQSEVTA